MDSLDLEIRDFPVRVTPLDLTDLISTNSPVHVHLEQGAGFHCTRTHLIGAALFVGPEHRFTLPLRLGE